MIAAIQSIPQRACKRAFVLTQKGHNKSAMHTLTHPPIAHIETRLRRFITKPHEAFANKQKQTQTNPLLKWGVCTVPFASIRHCTSQENDDEQQTRNCFQKYEFENRFDNTKRTRLFKVQEEQAFNQVACHQCDDADKRRDCDV